MSNSELIGCDLAWKRDGADWVLHHKRRRMGRVAPDHEHGGMYRVVLSRGARSPAPPLSPRWRISAPPARDRLVSEPLLLGIATM